MTSFTPSAWASAPTSLSSPATAVTASSGTKFLSFPYRRFKSHDAILASSDDGASAGETDTLDRVQLAFSKAKAYRRDKISAPPTPPMSFQKPSLDPAAGSPSSNGSEAEASIAVKLAMEKAKEYKKNKKAPLEEPKNTGEEDMDLRNSRKDWVENKLNKKDGLNISSKDFLGLDFSEKKSYRGNPPGLVTQEGSLFEGDVPEVEIIVGDVSKFERTAPRASTSCEADDSTGLYKPKVSTWGVFPRPKNISKTFGGGRVINFGETLETLETKEAKEKRSRDLISAYKRKLGLTIDLQTRSECEKALAEGDNLMDLGQLRRALPYYEKIMKTLNFQTELHGLAALQWSICQDSLSRSNEARTMYEKLQSHSNAEVRKKARQFMFSFQAMEMMKVKHTSFPQKTGFEDYFKEFVDNKAGYGYAPSSEEQNVTVLEQAFPYLIFLSSPLFIILFLAIKK